MILLLCTALCVLVLIVVYNPGVNAAFMSALGIDSVHSGNEGSSSSGEDSVSVSSAETASHEAEGGASSHETKGDATTAETKKSTTTKKTATTTAFSHSHKSSVLDKLKDKSEQLIIVLDPGHGGSDYGARSVDGKYSERELNLKMAKALEKELKKNSRFKVYITRGDLADNEKLSINDRMTYAGNVKADIFLCMHNNANFSANSGAECYVTASTATGLREPSYNLGNELMRSLGENGSRKRGVMFRISQAGDVSKKGEPDDYYAVIRMGTQMGMISLLLEHGYMNDLDLPLVNTDKKIAQLAKREAEALARFANGELNKSYSAAPTGDTNKDGKVNDKDIDNAVDSVLCDGKFLQGDSYDTADFNENGLIDAADLLYLYNKANGDDAAFSGTLLKNVKTEISAPKSAKAGGKITVTATVSLADKFNAACGTVDYNTELLTVSNITPGDKAILVDSDEDMGLLHYCLLSGDKAVSEIKITVEFEISAKAVTGSATHKRLSVNHSLYSIAKNGGKIQSGTHNTKTAVFTVNK
ncbi:MAG: N-acetylmuramoyl-L-alanine amidase [Oscillospiraceae bacterium]|nr:N-acetylmuramoyl-L-alanine amidase [Oscillospiraceae bacterium]